MTRPQTSPKVPGRVAAIIGKLATRPVPLSLVAALIIAGGLVIFAKYYYAARIKAPSYVGRVSYEGFVSSVDTSKMATGGPGRYEIDLGDKKLTVYLESGESSCDKGAISVPDVHPGEEVAVSGDQNKDGVVRVCQAGTYIRSLRSGER